MIIGEFEEEVEIVPDVEPIPNKAPKDMDMPLSEGDKEDEDIWAS